MRHNIVCASLVASFSSSPFERASLTALPNFRSTCARRSSCRQMGASDYMCTRSLHFIKYQHMRFAPGGLAPQHEAS